MAANEPPREAAKQADGSWILQNEDGSTMRWTRRPDGSWRKPEHKRAGWVGDLEQAKYVSKGAAIEDQRQAQMKAQIGRIPGAPPGAPPGAAGYAQGNTMTAAQKKNEKKKEKRQEKGEEKEKARLEPQTRIFAGTEQEDAENRAHDAKTQESSGVKNEKNIRKKLRQVEELEERKNKGETLNEDQLSKIAAKSKLEAELKAVLAGETVPAEQPEAKENQVPKAVSEVQGGDSTATKNRKAIEKKLRQVTEIEEKQKAGVALNDDQKAKLASKKQLQADLAACDN